MKISGACLLLVITIPTGCMSSENDNRRTISTNINIETKASRSHQAHNYIEKSYVYLEREKIKHFLNDPRNQLVIISEIVDRLKKKHLRFRQVHMGVPVWGKEIIVHFDENDSVYRISGGVLRGISIFNIDPATSPEDAGNTVLKSSQWGGLGWKITNNELTILRVDGNNYLTHQLTLTKGLLREFVFVDANEGVIIHRISGTH